MAFHHLMSFTHRQLPNYFQNTSAPDQQLSCLTIWRHTVSVLFTRCFADSILHSALGVHICLALSFSFSNDLALCVYAQAGTIFQLRSHCAFAAALLRLPTPTSKQRRSRVLLSLNTHANATMEYRTKCILHHTNLPKRFCKWTPHPSSRMTI